MSHRSGVGPSDMRTTFSEKTQWFLHVFIFSVLFHELENLQMTQFLQGFSYFWGSLGRGIRTAYSLGSGICLLLAPLLCFLGLLCSFSAVSKVLLGGSGVL